MQATDWEKKNLYLQKDVWPEYIKNSYNAEMRRETMHFKKDHKNCTATSEKQVHGRPTSTCKDDQRH